MLKHNLTAKVSLKEVVEGNIVLEGLITSDRLSRLSDSVIAIEKSFDVILKFGRNLSGKTQIVVKINGSVVVQCQRCLDNMNLPITVDTILTVVAHDDEAKSSIAHQEPIIIQNDVLEIDTIVEDEILLVLPIVAKHELKNNNQSCVSSLVEKNLNFDDGQASSINRRSTLGMENPFLMLKNLLIKKDKE